MKRERIRWNETELNKAIVKYILKNNTSPTSKDFRESNDLPSYYIAKNILNRSPISYGIEIYNDSIKHGLITGDIKEGKIGINWNAEKVQEAIDNHIIKYNKLPKMNELRPGNGLPSYGIAAKHLKPSPVIYCNQRLQELKEKNLATGDIKEGKIDINWTAEKVKKAIDNYIIKYNKLPKMNELRPGNCLPNYLTAAKHLQQSPIQLSLIHI